MSGALESIGASTKALAVLKDVPLWLLTAVAAFLLVFPLLPGAGDLLPPTALSWIRIAGALFAILAACRLGNILIPAVRAIWLRREERRTFHLTLNDSQSFWSVAKQPDGSVVTQFALRFMAKNRTTAPLYLLKSRVIRPKLRGEAIQDLVLVRAIEENLYGSAEVTGNYIPAAGLLPISVTILIRGKPKQTTGRLKMVIGVTDESGNETRVKLSLKGMP
jgi:hypothetical protein